MSKGTPLSNVIWKKLRDAVKAEEHRSIEEALADLQQSINSVLEAEDQLVHDNSDVSREAVAQLTLAITTLGHVIDRLSLKTEI